MKYYRDLLLAFICVNIFKVVIVILREYLKDYRLIVSFHLCEHFKVVDVI